VRGRNEGSPDDKVHEGAGRIVEVSDEDPLLQGPDVEVQDVHPLIIKTCTQQQVIPAAPLTATVRCLESGSAVRYGGSGSVMGHG